MNFSWDRTGNLRLQATRDFHTWTNVTDMFGFPGQNSWYVPWQLPYLEQYGDYFRLQFIPQTSSSPAQASPEIIPASSTSTSSSSQTIEARVLRCQPNPKGLQATVLTKPGRRYEVSVIDTHGKASQTRQFVAHSGTETVQFTTHGLPNPALIQAKLLK